MWSQVVVQKANYIVLMYDSPIGTMQNKVQKDMLNKDDDKAENEHQKRKKCRYYNRGYCKYTDKCRFIHPREICSMYMESQKCTKVNCTERHPKDCKWNKKAGGCRRQGCDFAHGKKVSNYKCEGCKDVWEDKSCVVEHYLGNMNTYFCLNCDEWIKNKVDVFNEGWTLHDNSGNLRYDV